MTLDWLDILTTILGLIYIWLEYRAHIALWVIGIVMPALDVVLYWQHGLYGDAGMACYYTLAAVYGLMVWKFKKTRTKKEPLPIIHMPVRQYLPVTVFFFVAWGVIYYILIRWTNSTVPVLDSFTNALSFVGLWALARKYLLDGSRCGLHHPLHTEGHTLQGRPLWALCHHRLRWLSQVELTCQETVRSIIVRGF